MVPLHQVYISLGSNMGDRYSHLQTAVDSVFEKIGTIQKISPVYETAAWGFASDDFLNAVLFLETNLTAQETLEELLKIEIKMGRKRTAEIGYQARPIDLDILFFDEDVLDTIKLLIPHPELQKRQFILQPLADIAPELRHPSLKKSVSQLLAEAEEDASIKKMQRWLKNPMAGYELSRFNYIAIEGNIGAGKTTLATKIANDFNGKLVLERFRDNPFLPMFYKDQSRYSFPLEMSFLADRYQQVHEDLSQLELFKDFLVADYDIYKSLIFAKITLQEEEYKLYRRLFEMMYRETQKPELYVFLFQSTEKLLENIKKRGREYEKSIEAGYLDAIQKGYLEFIKSQTDVKVKVIDITEMDFVENRKDYLSILKQITE